MLGTPGNEGQCHNSPKPGTRAYTPPLAPVPKTSVFHLLGKHTWDGRNPPPPTPARFTTICFQKAALLSIPSTGVPPPPLSQSNPALSYPGLVNSSKRLRSFTDATRLSFLQYGDTLQSTVRRQWYRVDSLSDPATSSLCTVKIRRSRCDPVVTAKQQKIK